MRVNAKRRAMNDIRRTGQPSGKRMSGRQWVKLRKALRRKPRG